MRLAVFSDTHGNVARMKAALHALRLQQIDLWIHCGDLGSEAIIEDLVALQAEGCRVLAVPGNVDEWEPDLIKYAAAIGLPLPRLQRWESDGIRFALTHGHDLRLLDTLTADPHTDIVFTGHTHVPDDRIEGTVRVLNPGALHRTPSPGYATFDTRTRTWQREALS